MFEEVPRTRRGLSPYLRLRSGGRARLGLGQLAARRIVLGPFVIGGGVVLAAIGSSVAVAATVFTASTIRASDVPPPHPAPVLASASPRSSAAAAPARTSHSATTSAGRAVPSTTAASPIPPPPAGSVRPSGSASSGSADFIARPASPSPDPTGRSASTDPTPQGNAVIYVSGWDNAARQLIYRFAVVSAGTGPQHSDVYSVAAPYRYRAGLAADITITSGGRICPPAGSRCTVAQLTAAAPAGFYAVVAVDSKGALRSVIEEDNAAPTGSPSSSPSGFGPGPSPAPSDTEPPAGTAPGTSTTPTPAPTSSPTG